MEQTKAKRVLFYGTPKLVKGAWARKLGIDVSYLPNPIGHFKFNLFINLYWATLAIRAGITR